VTASVMTLPSSIALTSTYGLTPARCSVSSRAGDAEPRTRGTDEDTMRSGYLSLLPMTGGQVLVATPGGRHKPKVIKDSIPAS